MKQIFNDINERATCPLRGGYCVASCALLSIDGTDLCCCTLSAEPPMMTVKEVDA